MWVVKQSIPRFALEREREQKSDTISHAMDWCKARAGCKLVYSDTDSIMFETEDEAASPHYSEAFLHRDFSEYMALHMGYSLSWGRETHEALIMRPRPGSISRPGS